LQGFYFFTYPSPKCMEFYIVFLALLFAVPIYLQIVVALWLQTIAWLGVAVVVWLGLRFDISIVLYAGLCALVNLAGWRLWLLPQNKRFINLNQKNALTENILDMDMIEQPIQKAKLWVRKLSVEEFVVCLMLVFLASYLSVYLLDRNQNQIALDTPQFSDGFLSFALCMYPLGLFLIARLHYSGFFIKSLIQLLMLSFFFTESRLVGDWEMTFIFSGLLFLTVLNAYFGYSWFKARQNQTNYSI
jgi:hypothetical protein